MISESVSLLTFLSALRSLINILTLSITSFLSRSFSLSSLASSSKRDCLVLYFLADIILPFLFILGNSDGSLSKSKSPPDLPTISEGNTIMLPAPIGKNSYTSNASIEP